MAARASNLGDLSACCIEMVSLVAGLEPGQSSWSTRLVQPSIDTRLRGRVSFLIVKVAAKVCNQCASQPLRAGTGVAWTVRSCAILVDVRVQVVTSIFSGGL